MEFLRNPEIRRATALYIVLGAAAVAAGGMLGREGMLLAAVICLVFYLVFLLVTGRRYRRLAELSRDIDRILHGEEDLDMSRYEEGELAILQNELSKMVTRLREQKETLERDKTYLADSIADISHQIRTPLTSTRLVTSFLREQEMSEERRFQLAAELNRLLDRIDHLIVNLLKISRLDTGTAHFQQEKVSVREMIARAAEPLAIPMELRNQELLVYQQGTEQFTGDIAWSGEALGNILKNCMEHTPEGGRIQIHVSENAIYTQITVQDNGTGIDKEDLPHLFERFYKGKNSGNESFGIGLALARMIVTRQHGTIKASNNREGGACFTIRFYHGVV